MNKIKAVGYIRVSTTDQQLSPEAQKEVITRWAVLNEIQLVETHQDIGLSGSTPWPERPGLTAALAAVKRHGASWLVVAKLDRLSRELFDQLHLGKELAKHDARFISCTEAPEANTPENALMQSVVGAFSEYERAMIRARIKAALAIRKNQGVRLGSLPLAATEYGRCLIWYIWWLRDQGLGYDRITKTCNENGITGPKGGKIHERNVSRLLKRDRPTVVPKAWRGPVDTWAKFSRDKKLAANRCNLTAPGGYSTGGHTAVGDPKDPAFGIDLEDL